MEDNIKELSTYPGFNIQLNFEALLTLHVENQHAVTPGEGGGGVLPILGYTGRLRPKGVPLIFQASSI